MLEWTLDFTASVLLFSIKCYVISNCLPFFLHINTVIQIVHFFFLQMILRYFFHSKHFQIYKDFQIWIDMIMNSNSFFFVDVLLFAKVRFLFWSDALIIARISIDTNMLRKVLKTKFEIHKLFLQFVPF